MSKHDAGRLRKRIEKKGNLKKILAVVAILTVLAVFSVYNLNKEILALDKFQDGSSVNGIDVSNLNAQQTKAKLTKAWNKHEIKIIHNGKKIGLIKNFDLVYDVDEQIDEALNPGFIRKVGRTISKTYRKYSIKMNAKPSKAFHRQFEKLGVVKNGKGKTRTRNAYVNLNNTKFEVVKEVFGDSLDSKKLEKAILDAIAQGDREFKYIPGKYFSVPTIRANSQEIKDKIEYANKYLKTEITLSGAGKKYKLKPIDLDTMISVKNDRIIVDRKAVEKFVDKKYAYFSTIGATRTLKLAGGTITVSGGNYGYDMDKKKQVKSLVKALETGKDHNLKVDYEQKGWGVAKGNDIGNTYLEVSIGRQHVWMVRNGKIVLSTPVVTGNVAEGNGTPYGTFSLMYKTSPATLEGENNDGSKYKTKVNYWMPFFAGCGFHDAPWRGSFGGSTYLRNGSHGCVNMPPSQAFALYGIVEAGMPVIVHG